MSFKSLLLRKVDRCDGLMVILGGVVVNARRSGNRFQKKDAELVQFELCHFSYVLGDHTTAPSRYTGLYYYNECIMQVSCTAVCWTCRFSRGGVKTHCFRPKCVHLLHYYYASDMYIIIYN